MPNQTTRPIWFYVSLVLTGIFIFQAGMWYERISSAPKSQAAPKSQTTQAETPPSSNKPSVQPSSTARDFVLLENQYDGIQRHPQEKALGDPNAPVRITEYLDVECPFCQRLNRNSVPQLIKKYVQTGKVYYQIRHFPLGMHERAVPAGNALECGVEQDHFWPLKYASVQTHGLDYSTTGLIALGEATGIPDQSAYESCVRSMKYHGIVQQEKQEGASRGVFATPTLFINDQKIQGARPYSDIKQAIEDELGKN